MNTSMRGKSKRGLSLLMAFVFVLSFIPATLAAPNSGGGDGELTYRLTEDFETNLSYEWPWTLSPGAWEIRPSENDRMWTNNRINQSLSNGPAGSGNETRTAAYVPSGSSARASRLHLIEPLQSDYRINIKFDWYPGAAPSAGGILGLKDSSTQDGSIEEFWTKYLTFAVHSAGVYYRVGSLTSDTVENTTPPIQGTSHSMRVGQPGVTEINTAEGSNTQWYTVNVDLNFRNNTLDLLVTNLDGTVTYTNVVDAPFLEEGEAVDGTFRSFSLMAPNGGNTWTTRIDNLDLRTYSACPKPAISDITNPQPRTGSFGMTIGAYTPMFPANNIVFNVYAKDNATGVEYAAGTASAAGAHTFTVPRGNATYTVTAEAAVDGVRTIRSEPLTLVMNEAGLLPPSGLVTDVTILPNNGKYELNWGAVTVDDPAVDRYAVYRSWYESGPYELIAEVNGTSYTDVNSRLSSNLRTYYKFVSMSPGGTGAVMSAAFYPSSIPAISMAQGKDRALSAVYLGGDKGAEINVSATGPDGEELTSGVYLNWRWYGADEALNTTFSLYRKDSGAEWELIASDLSVTNLVDPAGDQYSLYRVVGTGDAAQNLLARDTVVWSDFFLRLQVYKPADQHMTLGSAAGEYARYEANDSLLGDLDGDGSMDMVVKWAPTNAQDTSRTNLETGTTFYDGYKVNWQTGETRLLWRVDLGRGVRSGAHYSQFGVEDFAGWGYSQMIFLGAQGTTTYKSLDGTDLTLVKTGHVIDETHASVPINGPGGITRVIAIDGKTGEIIDATQHTKGSDDGRENVTVAWLDGHDQRPVFVTGGQYAINANNRPRAYRLSSEGVFTTQIGAGSAGGNANHQMMGIDLNGDGRDEIVFGGSIYNSDLTLMRTNAVHVWTETGSGFYNNIAHGDAMHISNWVPDDILANLLGISVEELRAQTNGQPRQYIMQVIEGSTQVIHCFVRDALTGTIVAGYQANGDCGRGLAIDAFPNWRGAEFWGSKAPHSADGNWDTRYGGAYSTENPGISLGRNASSIVDYGNMTKASDLSGSMNFSIFWSGDLLKEMQDHTFLESGGYRPISTNITKMDWVLGREITLFETTEAFTINGTKGNPNYQGDFLGDWREEMILRDAFDQSVLRVYQTTIQTDYVLPWMFEDSQYKSSALAQQAVYNQPPNPSYLPSQDVITARDLKQVWNSDNNVEFSYTPANDGLYGNGVAGHQLWRRTGSDNLAEIDLTPKGTLSNTTELALRAIGYEPVAAVTGAQNLIDASASAGTQYSYLVVGISADGKLSYVPDERAAITITLTSKIISVDYSGFTSLVEDCAANIPVTVNAYNPGGLDIVAGLFVDGELVASAPVAKGMAVIRAASGLIKAPADIRAWFDGGEIPTAAGKEVPIKTLAPSIWAPEVIVPELGAVTIVRFSENITLNSAKAEVTIDGIKVTGFRAEGKDLTIDAVAAEGANIVVKGVKYPELFPSYSFTFTLTRQGM